MPTNNALRRVVSHLDVSRRFVKWVTKLRKYDNKFEPQTTVKAQALADFLAEKVQVEEEEQRRIYVDGSSFQMGNGVGIVMISHYGENTSLDVILYFWASKNEA